MSLPLYQYEIRKARVISFVDAISFAAITMTSMTSAQKQPVFGAESGAGDTNSKMCEVVVTFLRDSGWFEAFNRLAGSQLSSTQRAALRKQMQQAEPKRDRKQKISRWLAVESCWK